MFIKKNDPPCQTEITSVKFWDSKKWHVQAAIRPTRYTKCNSNTHASNINLRESHQIGISEMTRFDQHLH